MILPAGLTHRPLALDDIGAVVEVIAASELAVLGEIAIEEADLVGDWARPSFDITTNTIGVFAGERLLGFAAVNGPGRGDAGVHPGELRRGIGTALAGWMQATARAQGQHEIGMPVPQGSPGERLLRSLGYRVRWTSWALTLPPERAIDDQPLPAGHTSRIANPEDLEPAYHVIEDAFLEWSRRPKATLADWLTGVTGRPGHEPWNLQVVTDPDGIVVGAVHVVLASETGYVAKVAVRRDQRGRGLARALLASAFRTAREHGATRSELATDSRTGVLDLYLGLGMEITSTWINLGIDL